MKIFDESGGGTYECVGLARRLQNSTTEEERRRRRKRRRKVS